MGIQFSLNTLFMWPVMELNMGTVRFPISAPNAGIHNHIPPNYFRLLSIFNHNSIRKGYSRTLLVSHI